jgi:hypothetical protein
MDSPRDRDTAARHDNLRELLWFHKRRIFTGSESERLRRLQRPLDYPSNIALTCIECRCSLLMAFD